MSFLSALMTLAAKDFGGVMLNSSVSELRVCSPQVLRTKRRLLVALCSRGVDGAVKKNERPVRGYVAAAD